jgi:hypothetical protein
MAITTLRPLRPRRAILLRKDAQLGLFGGETEVKPTAAAKRRERMLQPKAPPKPPKPSTRATAPKEGDTRINRAGNEEVLRAGRWRLASNPKVVAKDKGSAAIVPVVEADEPMLEADEDAIALAVEEPMVEAKQSVSAEEAEMQRYAAPDVTYTSDGPPQGFPGNYNESFARRAILSLKTRLNLLRSSEAIAKRNAKYSPEAYAESYEKHQRTKQAFLSSLTPLDDRLIDLLPPENTKRQVEIDKKIVEEWMDLNPVRVSADYVRVLAAMTPEEVIRRNMRSVPNQTLSDEFAKYAVRSGLYWKDSRTGGSFQLGPHLTRELKLADRARRIFGISVAETPDDRGQINKPAAKPKSRRKPVEPEPDAVPAEVVDDEPKPTKLGDRIRAIANDLRDENDEQKKIAARILGAAAQMAQNYDNLVGEVVDMVGEDLGEDIRSLNPDATQADVEMAARDGGSEPSPTRLADKMKAIANDLRNETNEQVKATARILDAAAQIAQNYDNLVDEVAEMVGEDLEAGGGAIAPAEAPPTKQEDINALKEFAEMRHWRGKDSLRLDPAMLDQFPDFKQYLIATGFIQAEDGSFFILDSASPLPSQIASDFPEVAEIDERHRQEKLEREAARAKEEEPEEPSPVPSPSKEPSKKGLNFLPTPEHVENFQRQVKAKFFGSPKKQAIQRNQLVLLDALDLLKQELMSSGWPVDEQKEYLSDLLNVGIWDDPNNLDGVKSGKDLMMMLENVMESAERQEAFARGAGVPTQADADAVMDWIEATDFKGSEKQVKWAKDIARKNAGKIAQLKAQGKTIPTDARWWIDNRSNNILLEISDLTKSLPPGPVFTLMGVPYIFDPHRAVLRKAGTSWEQFVADLSKEADGDPCWEGYEAVGMKKKRGKMVPNCVPVNR